MHFMGESKHTAAEPTRAGFSSAGCRGEAIAGQPPAQVHGPENVYELSELTPPLLGAGGFTGISVQTIIAP
jgi:hypothetical protein